MAALALSTLAPWTIGVPIVLPAIFIVVGLEARSSAVGAATRTESSTLRIFSDRLEFEGRSFSARTPMTSLRKITETADALILGLPSGDVTIPLRSIGGDPRSMRDALPANVPYERVHEGPVLSPSDRRGALLAVVAIVILVALRLALRQP